MRHTVRNSSQRTPAWQLLSFGAATLAGPDACSLGSVTRGRPRWYRGATNVQTNTLGAEGQCAQILGEGHREGKQIKGRERGREGVQWARHRALSVHRMQAGAAHCPASNSRTSR